MLLDPNCSKICVTSRSFSRNEFLKNHLKQKFKNVVFNDAGLSFNKNQLIEYLKDADGVILALDFLDEEVLSSCKKLKVISKYGVGLDNISFELLQKYDVKLGWTGGVNKRSVSELTLGFMLNSIRAAYESSALIQNKTWKQVVGATLTGKTIGIVGLGHVGKDLVSLLRPFGCKIIAYDTRTDLNKFAKENSIELVAYNKLLKESDIVTFHVPLTKKTKSMLNLEHKDLLKKGVILINTARGGIIDEAALCDLLKGGTVSWACLDVLSEEPPQFENHSLLSLPNLTCTTHIGGSASEAIQKMGLAAIDGLSNYKDAQFENFFDYQLP